MRTNRKNGIALVTTLLVLLLITSIILAFTWLVMTDQSMSGYGTQRQMAFYGAESGMEKLTADMNNLFAQNYSPSGAQVNNLFTIAQNPTIPGVSFVDYTPGVQNPNPGALGSGYSIFFQPDANGNPAATNDLITAGPYQGMQGLVSQYTLKVVAQGSPGGEVRLQRNVQTVGIPLFQFGMFSQTDLSFFAGPAFDFGGRVHTNGTLYLAEGDGQKLTMEDKVTAVGEVIRTNLSNGWPTSSSYNGEVSILTGPGSYRDLQVTEGSLLGTLGSGANPGWQNLSVGTYSGNLRDGDLVPPQYTGVNGTGARTLNITIATPQMGGTPIDLIRRPVQGEDATAPGKLGERYFAQASLRILLSDQKADIKNLPCETGTDPLDLSLMAQPVGSWPNVAPYNVIKAALGGSAVPLAASGAQGATYSALDGYWLPQNVPIIKGYIKIEAQTSYGVPCGTYQDVTAEILSQGYAGEDLNPGGYATYGAGLLPVAPNSQIAANSGCAEPHPNAIIRLERVRDNPSTGAGGTHCGTANSASPASDFWPNALFDPREGNPRDWCPDGTGGACKQAPELGGVMYYVELDVKNLTRWFTGQLGVTGPSTKDPNTAPNDFSVYFSDRRDNYVAAPLPSGWPPASPSGNETGEYGFNDTINPASQWGCPNGNLDSGEGLDVPQDSTVQSYGALAAQAPYPVAPGGPYKAGVGNGGLYDMMTGVFGSLSNLASSALFKNWQCGNPAYITTGIKIWPGWYVKNRQEARENPALFFRRALKLVNGDTINLGLCPATYNCGLAITSENPVYVFGNYNAPGGAFAAPYGAASVIADSLTLLSTSWNDVNSFSSTYDTAWRQGGATSYRLAVAAGKGISFPQPGGYGTYQDFGTDGGTHNFLRFIENWNGNQLNFKGSIVSLYYNRQDTGVYKCCTTVYSPPTRGYKFDSDFLTPAMLPPRTPMFRDINTTGFTEYVLPN